MDKEDDMTLEDKLKISPKRIMEVLKPHFNQTQVPNAKSQLNLQRKE